VSVVVINPTNSRPLYISGSALVDGLGNSFPIVNGVPRITSNQNYTDNFGLQWNKFDKIQLDRDEDGYSISRKRFFAETHWDTEDLNGKNILEVGSGAGRFSRVILEHTYANLYSIDYSDAVTANFRNNNLIAPDRFHLYQADIYEMPFPDATFDKVVCLGVLQHTPDFDASIKALVSKLKPGGEIVVDFYPINGWWTKIHAKYIFRPLTKRMSRMKLLQLIEENINWMMRLEHRINRLGLGFLSRFLPVVNITGTIPKYLSRIEKREWAILDTFDMFAPEYDNPQRIGDVAAMFRRHGAVVTFAGFEHFDGFAAAVVRGFKPA
jgi:SAM-dependent methyltransferase